MRMEKSFVGECAWQNVKSCTPESLIINLPVTLESLAPYALPKTTLIPNGVS